MAVAEFIRSPFGTNILIKKWNHLMLDVFEVANILVDNVVENFGNEVDIIAFYGSHARDDAREDSDLDIFYTPVDGKDPPIRRTFLLEGRLFDFWAIRWETLEGFATGRIRGWAFSPALVYHSKSLYVRSPDQAIRLDKLKQQIIDLQKPESRPQMIKRSLEMFPRVLAYMNNLHLAASKGDFTDVRYAGWMVIEAIWECLALANQVFFERGLAKSLSEIEKFDEKPDRLQQLVANITTSPDLAQILSDSEQLVRSTRQVLQRIQGTIPSNTTVQDKFRKVYPEFKDAIGKLQAACKRGDQIAASAEAWLLQSEVALMLNQTIKGLDYSDFNLYSEFGSLYRDLGFPDLIQFASGNLETLIEQAVIFEKKFRNFLLEQSVDLCEYQNIEELKRSF